MKNNIYELISNQVNITNTYAAIIGKNPSNGAKSPELWNKEYSRQNLPIRMYPFDVSRENLTKLLMTLSSDKSFIGGAIAAPYKEIVFEYLGKNVTKEANVVGSVNNLFRNNDGDLIGHNTDGEGFVKSLTETFKIQTKSKIMILGYGGTGKAVVGSLSLYSEKNFLELEIGVLSRQNIKYFKQNERVIYIDKSYKKEWLESAEIIINCTNRGSKDCANQYPICEDDFSNIKGAKIAADVIYDPPVTPFLEKCLSLGIGCINGVGMNKNQAVLGFNQTNSINIGCSRIERFKN